jgi:hypothetical protein
MPTFFYNIFGNLIVTWIIISLLITQDLFLAVLELHKFFNTVYLELLSLL